MKINMRRMNRLFIVVVSARQMSHAFVYDINKQARIENEQQQQLTYQCVGFFFLSFSFTKWQQLHKGSIRSKRKRSQIY